MRRPPAFVIVLLLSAAGLIAPSRTLALALAPDPLSLTDGSGHVDFVGMTTGLPVGGITQVGSIGPGDITLIFQFTSTWFALHLDAIGIAETGAGWIPSPDADVVASFSFVSGVRVGYVNAIGGLTDPFFISVPTLAGGDSVTVGLLVIDVEAGELVIAPRGQFQVVPEPSLALLVATAFVGLGVRRHRLR